MSPSVKGQKRHYNHQYISKKKLHESGRKPNKILVYQGSEFKRSMKSWLDDNGIEMCSIHNEGNLLLQKYLSELRRTKNLPVVSKNVYIDQLDEIVNKCRKTCFRKIKIKLFCNGLQSKFV